MNLLTKSTEYAIRALVYIQLQNDKDIRPGVIDIAKKIEAPEAYLAKILQTLTKHNFLGSAKGRGGGFFLSDDQSNSTIYEIVFMMEGNECFENCGFGLKNCKSDNPCPLHTLYVDVREEFCKSVKSETIKTLSQKIIDGKAVLSHLEV